MIRLLSTQHRKGFTLLELLAVLTIMAMLMGWGLLNLRKQGPGYELDKEASRIAGILRDARDRAVLDGRAIRLEITPAEQVAPTGQATVSETTRVIEYFYDQPAAGQDLLDFYDNDAPFLIEPWDENVILDRALVGRDEAYAPGEPIVLRFWPSGLCTPVRLYVYHRRRTDVWQTVRLNPLTGLTKITKGQEEPEEWELRVSRQDTQR
jgi:prepilin-type N-terminal cleavage/methylation domain-containing protein